MHLSRLRSVQSLPVSVRVVYAPDVMVRTWQQEKPYRLVRQSELWQHSPSESQVHSLPCVHSITVELPETISLRVFLVSRSFLRQESRRDLQSSQSLPDVQRSVIQRKSVKLLLQMKRQANQKLTLSLMDLVLRSRTEQCSVPEMSLQKVV